MCEPRFRSYEASNPVVWRKSSMKRTHQLIELKTETVKKLKRLRIQMDTKSLDDLIARMNDLGWGSNSTG